MNAVMPTPGAADTERRLKADWAESAAYNAFYGGMRTTQLTGLALASIVVALAYRYVPDWLLLAWTITVLCEALWLKLVRRHYEKLGRRQRDAARQLRFARAQRPLWLFNAMFWGLTPLMLFHYMPTETALLAWLPVIAGGLGRTSYLASHLHTARMYLSLIAGALTLSVGVGLVSELYVPLGMIRWAMPVVLVLYLLLFARLIRVHYARNAESIDVLYQNKLLIQSLQAQTHAAKAAAEFRTRFLAGAAHDLKQPISALGIYAEWLGSEPQLVDELAPKILQATQAINTLFDSMFDLAKLDVHRIQPDLRTVQVRHLLEDLHVQYRPLAVQKGLTLRLRTVDAQLVSDPIILRRILGNLVSNAIRYTSNGGVLLAARQRGDHVLFEVWDTGIGIAADQHVIIFDEFYKVPQRGTNDGFGLGLALVRRLAELMDYPLTLRSRLARGTMFRVRVPLTLGGRQGAEVAAIASAGRDGAQSAASASAT